MNRILFYLMGLALLGTVLGCEHFRGREDASAELLDLSSPEATVCSFTRAAAQGESDLAQACFLPGGIDYDDIKETLTAEPSSPRYPGKVMMESVDAKAPMKVLSKKETEYGLKVVWQVTFAKGFEIEGQKIEAGSTYDFDATLKKTENGWMIDNF